MQRSELCCFFTRKTLDEAVIGFGVKVQRRPGGRGSRTSAAAAAAAGIQSLSTQTDYVSLEAFVMGVRHSAWNMPFDAFLPLVRIARLFSPDLM